MNPFTDASSAARYFAGRPYFHPLVIERIRKQWGSAAPPRLALDAGAGTGLSAQALLTFSRRVIALDSSIEMLARIPLNSCVGRVLAACESLPLAAASVDLITAGQVIHWLELESFSSEARRVLKPGGLLVTYDNYFVPEQPDIPGFREWFEGYYLRRYPSPQRNTVRTDDASAWNALGFALESYERYENYQRYTLNRFIDYLLTQSNVISAVEGGREDVGVARAWLGENLAPFFGDRGERRFLYDGPIAFLRAFAPPRQRTQPVEAAHG